MSKTFKWCKDETKLGILDKHIFYVNRNGTKAWWLNDKLHRENGPAIEDANGNKWHHFDSPPEHRHPGVFLTSHKQMFIS